MGLSENRVPQNLKVNHHFPHEKWLYLGVYRIHSAYPIFRLPHMEPLSTFAEVNWDVCADVCTNLQQKYLLFLDAHRYTQINTHALD